METTDSPMSAWPEGGRARFLPQPLLLSLGSCKRHPYDAQLTTIRKIALQKQLPTPSIYVILSGILARWRLGSVQGTL